MLQVKNFREQHGISQRDAVNVIREQFSGFDKHLLQQALNKAGYDTIQDGLEAIINEWLGGR